MNLKLLKYCKNKEEKEEVKRLFKRNHRLLDILVTVLEEDLKASEREFKSEANYHNVNWDKYIVDKLSEQRTLEYVIDLISSSYSKQD